MKITGAELTIKIIEKMGITHIAGIPGGSNLPLYDALSKSRIKHILTRHEQGAGFIAQGFARSSGKPGVCFATSGPGMTNLITAIADAYLDSVPIIAITGQVASNYLGSDAFQEIDAYGLTLPITKHNFLIKSVEELPSSLIEGFNISVEGRPGPVLIDIPKDIQQKEINLKNNFFENIEGLKKIKSKISGKKYFAINKIIDKINNAKKPLLLIGGGIIQANASDLIQKFAKKISVPVVSTLMGLGAFPGDDKQFLGMIGMHGSNIANKMLYQTDLLMAFGVRFGDRATGAINKFCPGAEIIHIDIDNSEINKLKKTNIYLNADIKPVLEIIISEIKRKKNTGAQYFSGGLKNKPNIKNIRRSNRINPAYFIKKLGSFLKPDDIVVTDVGQHQMWTAQHYQFKKPRTFLTSGGLGTMGFGLPVAIGASISNPDKKIVCITGDGSFMMNIQELATLAELNCNISVFIMNNGGLGLVRQQQELFYNKNYFASKFALNPDFAKISEGFSIKSRKISSRKNIDKIINDIINDKNPVLANVEIDGEYNVFPMVPPGAANSKMIGGNQNEQ